MKEIIFLHQKSFQTSTIHGHFLISNYIKRIIVYDLQLMHFISTEKLCLKLDEKYIDNPSYSCILAAING